MTTSENTPFNRRTFLKGSAALSGSLVLTTALVGCGDDDPPDTGGATTSDDDQPASSDDTAAASDDSDDSADEPEFSGDLSVWGIVSFTQAGDAFLGQQMVDWGEENGVEIEYQPLPGSDYNTRLATAVEAGAVPDIIMLGGDLTIYYASQDRLVDMTDVYDELKDLSGGMYEALESHVRVEDQIFSIPMQADVSVMYARLDLCEEATGERKAPETLDELEEIAREINDPPRLFSIGICLGRTPDGNGDIINMILADGGTLVDEDGNPSIDNDGTLSALDRIQRWWTDDLIPPDSVTADDAWNNQVYQSGNAAFVFNPASIFAYLEENDPDLLADTTQELFPRGSAGSFPNIGTWAWAVSADSDNIDAAKAMIKAIMQPEMVDPMYAEVGGRWYPVYKDLSTSDFWAERPFFDAFPDIIETGREQWYPATATPQLLTQLSAVTQRFIIPDMVQNVLLNDMSIEDAAQECQNQMELIFEEFASS